MNELMRSSVMGLLLGQFSSPLPMAQKEPVAYLYNGVRLPKLPEWDREKYPYAVILYDGLFSKGYWFVPLVSANTVTTSGVMNGLSGADIQYHYDTETQTWVMGEILNIASPHVKWANYDVTDTFGNAYLSASDPIPVYE